jgi:hypothetical protein
VVSAGVDGGWWQFLICVGQITVIYLQCPDCLSFMLQGMLVNGLVLQKRGIRVDAQIINRSKLVKYLHVESGAGSIKRKTYQSNGGLKNKF